MGKSIVPDVPRRSTRSATMSESTVKASGSESADREKRSLDDLIHHFPGRKSQINSILQIIGPLNSPMLPLFIYGAPSTGKTSVTTQALKHLNRPFIYTSLRSCYHPRILYDHVMKHLSLLTKIEFPSVNMERASDFIYRVKEALTKLKKSTHEVNGEMIYLVFDSIEAIHDWDQGSDFASIILKLHDLLNSTKLGLIYISSKAPDSYYLNYSSTEPLSVFFPNYSEEEVYNIFMRNQLNPKLYSSFLRAVLKPFYRVTRRLDELYIAFKPLFKKYCEFLSDPKIPPDETMNRRLYDAIHPFIAPSMDDDMMISSRHVLKDNLLYKHRSGGTEALEFSLSRSSKYLLLSAFLASRNPPTLDSSMFDSTGGISGNKRKRKSSEASKQKNEHNMQLMVMKGPGSFSLERLLAIFQCINSTSDFYDEELTVDESQRSGSTPDVLLQLTSLCKVNLILNTSSCPLEGFTRYRCTIDEKTALKVARSISFPLAKYLYRC